MIDEFKVHHKVDLDKNLSRFESGRAFFRTCTWATCFFERPPAAPGPAPAWARVRAASLIKLFASTRSAAGAHGLPLGPAAIYWWFSTGILAVGKTTRVG